MTPELEKANNEAVNKVGEQTLIRFLGDINRMMSFKPGLEYEIFESIVCQYFNVRINDLYRNDLSHNTVDCRKVLSFMLLKHTDMNTKSVCFLLHINERTLQRYKHQLFTLIEMPKANPELFKAYNYLNKVFLKMNNSD